MTPQSHLPNTDPFTLTACGGILAAVVEKVPHKILLTIAGAIISVLMYWGFNTTLDRLKRIEDKQDVARVELKTETDRIYARDAAQDLCITTLTERQNVVIKTIEELKGKHNGPSK